MGGLLLGAAVALGLTAVAPPAEAVEPAACLLPDPSAWPAPSKPYFMIAFDTSAKMNTAAGSASSCNFMPTNNTLLDHGRCAVKNTVLSFAGQVNLGLSTGARVMSGCNASCYGGCGWADFPGNIGFPGCGPEPVPDAFSTSRAGANIVVPLQADDYWNSPPQQSNTASLLQWVDNSCASSAELFADTAARAPLNGALRDMYRYFSVGWTSPLGAPTYPSPLGTGAQGERACRSVNVILITAGDEGCDSTAQPNVNDAVIDAAAQLHAGFTVGGIQWKVKVFVINFTLTSGGGNQLQIDTDKMAAAGGTGAAYIANNETQLAQAFANIIGGSVGPETCDNADNNCNGCTDEGYTHYCDQGQTCCAWATDPERATCLSNYTGSITPANPSGNLALLPCTTMADQSDPLHWLCYDPKEVCDDTDNNCDGTIDENQLKCGNPSHCPIAESCDGLDNNCNGVADEGGVCTCLVAPSPEICDGCDNDCDGMTDDGVAAVACGLLTPANCVGTAACKAPVPVTPGGCIANGGYQPCSNAPASEICDGVDNNCNGIIDDGIPALQCVPAGVPANLVYGGTSQCQMGSQSCGGLCLGFIGPSVEVCDGVDNDCDGQVDESAFGVGQPCGFNAPPCTPGTTSCVNGALVCQGGSGPQNEICDGVDNNCNGVVDDPPLADGPAAGQNGCWNLPGPGCNHVNLDWGFPPGASCTDNVSLTAPCNHGTLACAGGAGWICQGSNLPNPETCDGLDNDCNGVADDGNLPQVGQACGVAIGLCVPGAIGCVAGVLDCLNDVGPVPEQCNGLDDDCDGVIDNGVAGVECDPVYDAVAYPGDRSFQPCKKGITQCTGQGGTICVGAVGPSPELCDNVDNDCDGLIDETMGVGVDSVSGTPNQTPPPIANIGDVCGQVGGECSEGVYACVNGTFQCVGQQDPIDEACDCLDNDCNGIVDNQNANGTPLCSADKECVSGPYGCQCAKKCSGEVQPCPGGQACVQVTSSETDVPLGDYCVDDPCPSNCFNATTKDAGLNIICGPAGTPVDDCGHLPACSCKAAQGCQPPCFGVTCAPGSDLACTNFGPNAGTCVVDNCFNFPCDGCGTVCSNAGACVPNPCQPESCPGETCAPSADFLSFVCSPSCAGINCPSGQICQEGACVDTCPAPCPGGQVCSGVTCVQSLCAAPTCADGSYCDPLTGACGSPPCEGVVCPAGQACTEGTCYGESGGTGGSGAGSTTSGAGAGSAASTGTGEDTRGIWGLATGGGGCACEVGAGATSSDGSGWALVALGLSVAGLRRGQRRKSKRSSASAAGEVA